MSNKEKILKEKEALAAKFKDDFGLFIKTKREQRGMSIRGAAVNMEITAAYLSDIERGKEKPPTQSVIDRMSATYFCKVWEHEFMMDLSAKSRGQLPRDITLFMQDNLLVRTLIRLLTDAKNELTQETADKIIKNAYYFVDEMVDKAYKEERPGMFDDEPKDEEGGLNDITKS